MDKNSGKYLYKVHSLIGWQGGISKIAVPNSGTRQIQRQVGNEDQRLSADYLAAKYVKIDNKFEGLFSNYGLISLDSNPGSVKFDDWYYSNQYPYPLTSTHNASLGLSWQFLNWSDGVTTANRTVLVNQDITLTANWKAMMASKSSGWVQSPLIYSGNGTSSVVYYSTDPTYSTGLWVHQESGTGTREINVLADGWTNCLDTPPQSVAVSDYNRQKTYVGYINFESGIKIVSVREYINGIETGFTTNMVNETDPVVQNLTSNAKLYISSSLSSMGGTAPTHANLVLLTIIDGSSIYYKTISLSGSDGSVVTRSGWTTMTNAYTPKFVTNGRVPYLVWLENGSVKCLRYKPGTNWGNPYTLYSNGPFYDVAAAVTPGDDLVLMMKRINSGGPALCTGKFYVNGSTMPLTVLETTTTGNYLTHSLAAEGTKLLSVVGKMPSAGQPYTYNLWKHNGSSWSKEVSGTSTPKKLLHNEVDVTAYEFATATTPVLYALKTTSVNWGPSTEKVDQETGLSVVAARLGDTLTWYTTVDPVSVDSMLVDTTGLWHIVVKTEEAREILISGLNRFGSAVWVDSSRTVQFTPAEARYTFWVVDPTGNKMRYAKDQADPEEAEFKLEDQVSVFPNPFNPATVFSVTVAEPSRVKLHIYNVIGQQVAEIVNTDLTAGVHDYRLNAGSWASGTYFYRLQIGDKLKSGKIQLVK
ncbi:MAG: T9SS type A sorting domain-containing protein [Bacteroidetes bacterium]|nr:T9SS type A sorting domain-containing protein [Bacteroidota bacterium]